MAENQQDWLAAVKSVLTILGGGTVVGGFVLSCWSSFNKGRFRQLQEECIGWRRLYEVAKAENELMTKKIFDQQEIQLYHEKELSRVQKDLMKALDDELASEHRAKNAENDLKLLKEHSK